MSNEDGSGNPSRPGQPSHRLTSTHSVSEREEHRVSRLAGQIRTWIKSERAKHLSPSRKQHWVHSPARRERIHRKSHELARDSDSDQESIDSEALLQEIAKDPSIQSSIASRSLDNLEKILEDAAVPAVSRRLSRRHSLKNARKVDQDQPAEPPTCDVYLDLPDKIGKDRFKEEVLKLAHTLGCKGWRKISLDNYKSVSISKISGALTNSVFAVSLPKDHIASGSTKPSQSGTTAVPLLLRVYGAQVSHLIDRESELKILRRLARQRIGPRLLGTFANGRFEQFFEADTLTKDDIRDPDDTRFIAKRMCELHTGMELEPEEVKGGPGAWKNWRKWKPLAQAIDEQRERPILGYPWKEFAAAVETYIDYVEKKASRENLVFAHNDAQYGNILRKKSPAPDAPPHKSLIVIDFEYAGPNARGYEFANHFCEWMADYHAEKDTYIMHESRFPTVDEMKRFCTAYLEQVNFGKGSTSPIDDSQVMDLVRDAVLWVPASHMLWCAWGIVQAKAEDEGELDPDDFDYIGYARQRAALFWGDLYQLGILSQEKLKGKTVKYSGERNVFSSIVGAGLDGDEEERS